MTHVRDRSPERARDGLVLAVDQGTTNTRAVLVDPSGHAVASASCPVAITFPSPGWVEQDADQLWDATRSSVLTCLDGVDAPPVALAISNQRESVVAWSRRTGEPLGPVLGWQDARTAAWCGELAASGLGQVVRERTGLSLDPMFSAPKMRWLLDAATVAGVDAEDVLLGTVDSWLVWNLTGEHLIEAGNASRTLLLNLRTLAWDDELCAGFDIPRASLPEVRDSDGGFGVTDGRDGIPAGIPVAAVPADSHAALYRHGCTRPGSGKATYGTGTSVMTPCDGPGGAPEGIATTLAWVVDGRPTYAREGNIVASGSALDWMARILGASDGVSGGAYLTDLAATVPDAGGVAFVPAFSGLGAPYWDRQATGVLVGVTGGTRREHLARAALEAVAHQVADVVEAIERDGGARIDTLHADGGATASGLLMRLQAEIAGRPLRVADAPEASALGAAALGYRAVGVAVDPAEGAVVTPDVADPTERSERRGAWARAVARARGHEVPPLLNG